MTITGFSILDWDSRSRIKMPSGPWTTRTIYDIQQIDPLTPSVRRSSVFPGAGRQSMALGGAAISSRDSRPYRDKAFQNACQENVADYLSATRCPIVLTQKTLLSPTQKEFQTIFKFLISEQIDRGYQFTKKFEDECVSIMKDLKYPAMEHLGKTALATPGTPQYWPGFLAMFNWLVDLCKVSTSSTEYFPHRLTGLLVIKRGMAEEDK